MTALEKVILYAIRLRVQAGNVPSATFFAWISKEINEPEFNMDFIKDKFITMRTDQVMRTSIGLTEKADSLREVYKLAASVEEDLAEVIKQISTEIVDC